ncbi:MAG: O-antigen ligase family protein, partial [Desulfobacterales bacterium]|nr:O-antigen ligase family protein [Desulfobacterales bacterium]
MIQNNSPSTYYSRTALSIICSLIVFSPLARGAVHPWAVTLIQAGVILATLCLVFEKLVHPGICLAWPIMSLPLAFIVLLCLVSFVASKYEPFAREGFLMVLIYGGAYLATSASVRTRKEQRVLVHVIVFTAVLLCLIGLAKRYGLPILGWWAYPEVGPNHGAMCVSGPYVNRNHLAGFLGMAIPFSLALLSIRCRTWKEKQGMVLVVFLLLITLALTQSRGGWIAIACSLLFMSVLTLMRGRIPKKKNLAMIVVGLSVLSLAILSSLPVVERITTLTEKGYEDNLAGRIRCWKGAVNMIRDNIMFGTGPDTFTVAYPAWQVPGQNVLRGYAHNDYLHFLSETGIFFVPVALFSLFVFYSAGFLSLSSRSRQQKYFTLAAMGSVF